MPGAIPGTRDASTRKTPELVERVVVKRGCSWHRQESAIVSPLRKGAWGDLKVGYMAGNFRLGGQGVTLREVRLGA